MRAPPFIKDFLAWRWAPCVALTMGSLAFVCLALLLVPSQIDPPHSADASSAFDQPTRGTHAMYNASLAQGAALAQNTVSRSPTENAPQPARFRTQPPPPSPMPVARGFSPVIERAEPPAPPPELAPPAPPPMMPNAPLAADALPAPAPPPPEADVPHREN